MIRELNGPFGNVCPLLKLSEHYDVDYTAVLEMADYLIHGRQPCDINETRDKLKVHGDFAYIRDDMKTITDWMLEQHREAKTLEDAGRLTFDRSLGKWIATP